MGESEEQKKEDGEKGGRSTLRSDGISGKKEKGP